MSIDANVAYVAVLEDGSGTLHLCDRVPEGSRGQSRLRFASAPYEVTALNGLQIWGSSTIMLGDQPIARREGHTKITFVDREAFRAAVAAYHQRERAEKARDTMTTELRMLVERAIELLKHVNVRDCGIHACRYCPARSPGWHHSAGCLYKESQRLNTEAGELRNALTVALTNEPKGASR